jgi:hypothetical protein
VFNRLLYQPLYQPGIWWFNEIVSPFSSIKNDMLKYALIIISLTSLMTVLLSCGDDEKDPMLGEWLYEQGAIKANFRVSGDASETYKIEDITVNDVTWTVSRFNEISKGKGFDRLTLENAHPKATEEVNGLAFFSGSINGNIITIDSVYAGEYSYVGSQLQITYTKYYDQILRKTGP